MKSPTGEDFHRDTINFRILGYSIFLAFVSVILAITLMKRYCECCYDDPKRTDDLNINYWLHMYPDESSKVTAIYFQLILLLISMPNIWYILHLSLVSKYRLAFRWRVGFEFDGFTRRRLKVWAGSVFVQENFSFSKTGKTESWSVFQTNCSLTHRTMTSTVACFTFLKKVIKKTE